MLLLALAAAASAKLVIVGHENVVITYPTMQRCMAAKLEMERQYDVIYRRDLARGIMRTPPTVYCLPG